MFVVGCKLSHETWNSNLKVNFYAKELFMRILIVGFVNEQKNVWRMILKETSSLPLHHVSAAQRKARKELCVTKNKTWFLTSGNVPYVVRSQWVDDPLFLLKLNFSRNFQLNFKNHWNLKSCHVIEAYINFLLTLCFGRRGVSTVLLVL